MCKPSILMISNYLDTVHHNKNVWHALAERLQAVGWDVITTSSKENQIVRLIDMLWTTYALRKCYEIAQVDVFSGKAFIFAEACSCLLNVLGKPIVLTLHGGALPDFADQYPNRVDRLLRSADVVVTPSPFLQDKLKQYRHNIRFIPNPIDNSSVIYRQRKKITPRLIWVRAFHKIYNPSMAIFCVDNLLDNFPDIFLTMVGPDKKDGSLIEVKTLLKKLNLEDRIRIIPGVPHQEIPALLDQADIFINTSNYDVAPRSVTEAMANGLCIVSTDVGGVPYLITDHQHGLLVPSNQPSQMARAIKNLIENPSLAAQISSQAHEKAMDNDWSVILPQWECLFLEVIEAYNG